jgi:uncharacterized SAM-binding protein YcdF (DUF218 family)
VKQRCWRQARAVTLSIALLVALAYLGALVWVGANLERDTAVRSDTVIVLGAQAYVRGTWNPCLVSRVRHGVRLVQRGLAEHLILSGGVDREDGWVEAEVMRDIALDAGADPESIRLEPRSTSTAENLEFSRAIMQRAGWRDAIIVSDPYHLPRASLIAQKLRLAHTVSPAMDSPCWAVWRFTGRNFLREPLALLENWWRGSL